MKTAFIILAAGRGSRFRSQTPKVLQPLAGKPMLLHLLDSVEAICGTDDAVYVVTHYQHEQVTKAVGARAQCVLQPAMDGTAGAVAVCTPMLADYQRVLVLYGDVPLLAPKTMQDALACVMQETPCVVLTAQLADASGYGRIVRSDMGHVVAIVEEKDATEAQRAICEINTGVMAFATDFLCSTIDNITNNNAQQERYLTDMVAVTIANKRTVCAIGVPTLLEVQGVNTHIQLADLERAYQRTQAEQLLAQGVRIIDPSRFDVRGSLRVGTDVTIDVGCVFVGDVVLGNGVSIGAYSIIENTTIDQQTQVLPMSIITEAVIGAGCTIGPYVRLRPKTRIDDNCRVGNFVELKNTSLAKESKVNHLSYLGDATVGNKVNVGAGVISCNYDGQKKHQTHISDGVFVGSNVSLVAPIDIGAGVTIAAGSVITKSVEKGLAVSRARQRNLPNW